MSEEKGRMDFGRIRAWMEHYSVTRVVLLFLRKLGLIHFVHIMLSNKKKKQLKGKENDFSKFVDLHKEELQQVFDYLEDDFSKETLRAVIDYRKSYEIGLLKGVTIQPQYFLKELLPPSNHEVFIDGGAYIGDSSREFLLRYQTGEYYKIFLWEPDENNSVVIKKTLGEKCNYEIIPYALWNGRERLNFIGDGTGTSMVTKQEGNVVNADSIDNIHGNETVTFIKMDIEGAEIEALKGAERVIKTQKPKLAISIYHNPSHLYEIPIMIKSMVPEYKLYIRHHSDMESETVLYARI
ncbi:MAG: FkbM family methyltransferase [Lachnospiraceae bacterium]|nr:FkbM family methyltransferase [Lachnospiraceae bacterium]